MMYLNANYVLSEKREIYDVLDVAYVILSERENFTWNYLVNNNNFKYRSSFKETRTSFLIITFQRSYLIKKWWSLIGVC